MRTILSLSVVLLACSPALGGEEATGPTLHREKKDIAKLQALFGGGWKQPKPYPVVNFEEFKRPVYYVPQVPQQPQQPPCNCNWRPTTRYGEAVVGAAILVPTQAAKPLVAIPPPPPSVVPSYPARQAPPPPPPQPAVIPAAPALDNPCLQEGGYHYDRPHHN